MPFYLSKSEQRALLLISFIIITAILIEWLVPHQVNTEIYDYSLQDSLFKALSAEPVKKAAADINKKKTILPPGHTTKTKPESPLKAESVNINTAGKEELTRLPRIGPKIAARIIAYRKANGPFKNISEIKKVKGIGDKTFQKLRPYITIR